MQPTGHGKGQIGTARKVATGCWRVECIHMEIEVGEIRWFACVGFVGEEWVE